MVSRHRGGLTLIYYQVGLFSVCLFGKYLRQTVSSTRLYSISNILYLCVNVFLKYFLAINENSKNIIQIIINGSRNNI
jgi:hypothetical protein